MDDQALEQRIRTAAEHAAPDVLDRVLSSCGKQKGRVIPMTEQKKPRRALWGAIAACLLLALAGGGGGFWYWQTNAVASIVSLDVNPSIELRINRQERVLSCTPLNADAAQVLFEMDGGKDLEGSKLDVAVNAIVGALVRHGYLDSISSALLISVEDSDQDRADRLRQELTGTVAVLLEQQSSGANVYGQIMTQDAGLDQLAQTNNISAGKAALVKQVLDLNSNLDFDKLADLSVEELEQLIETGAPGMPIGKSEARHIAEEYAGTWNMNSVTAEVDPELDERTPHYEVELHTSFGEFEYEVDAYTGAILSGQPDLLSLQEPVPSPAPSVPDAPAVPSAPAAPSEPAAPTVSAAPSTPAATPLIGEDAAKSYAFTHANCAAGDVFNLSCELDYDDGVPECYEVEFCVGDYCYEYEIDCHTGAVLDHECEHYTSSGHSHGGGSHHGGSHH